MRKRSNKRSNKRRISIQRKNKNDYILEEPKIKRESKLFIRDILRSKKQINYNKYQHGDLIALEPSRYRNDGIFMIIDDNGHKYPYLISGFLDEYGHVIPIFDCSNKKYNNAFKNITHNDIRFVRPKNYHLIEGKTGLHIGKPKLEELIKIDKKYGPFYIRYNEKNFYDDEDLGDDFAGNYNGVGMYRVEKRNGNLVVVHTVDGKNTDIVEKLVPFSKNYQYDYEYE